MTILFTAITEYLRARLTAGSRSETGQSTVEYLVIIVGAAIIATAVVAGITVAVNGKLPNLKL
jgi:hypothetical protein